VFIIRRQFIFFVRIAWVVIGISGGFMSLSAWAEEASNEYKIKAGYLYNFTKFITWPQDNSPTFNLCILAADPFGGLIDPIEKRTVSERAIKVYRFADAKNFKDDSPPLCHILFTSSAKPPTSLPANTLTVGERENFAEDGGMIEFMNKDSRIKLLLNLRAIRQSGLKVSAKLLEVAEIIAGDKP